MCYNCLFAQNFATPCLWNAISVRLGVPNLNSSTNIMVKRLSEYEMVYRDADRWLIVSFIVFVTGNANKLREVKAILSDDGGHPIDIDSQSLDSKCFFSYEGIESLLNGSQFLKYRELRKRLLVLNVARLLKKYYYFPRLVFRSAIFIGFSQRHKALA